MAATPALKILPVSAVPGLEELFKMKKEAGIPPLKVMDPLSVVEMALEVEVERARAAEALAARDAAIQRLSDAYLSIRQNKAIIERLQQGSQAQPQANHENEQVLALEITVKTLREELAVLNKSNAPAKFLEPPPSYGENGIDHGNPGHNPQLVRPATSSAPLRLLREVTLPARPATASAVSSVSDRTARIVLDDNDLDYQVHNPLQLHAYTQPAFQVVHAAPKSNEPEDIIKARHALLATIPLPENPPDDTLKPIVIPPSFTLQEFLANAPGSLRNALSNYRVFQELTTSWCPEREEHGYLLTPLFKCSTNPRVATAHRWNMVDVMTRINKPTECFYNKDGNWYYAGVYKAFRLANLTTKEWDALSTETTQALIKETIAGRKNTSPQNVYETGQLYAAGALKVACLGLQCVGFNKALYLAILEQAAKCALVGKWKAAVAVTAPSVGLGSVGGAWNAAAASDVTDGMAGMKMSGTRSENTPVHKGK
ncbi:hypothetical protein GGX14DRAFT_429784 [Mycena pura]|uniref:DUF6697 domain-containing protein n=1 Tax=Mycena pura TaxID=153505 RepID=A0AAD6VSH5_9AGAR|nr:hypothetical protein GGX14DRAFT_429784 [Mycena pura]